MSELLMDPGGKCCRLGRHPRGTSNERALLGRSSSSSSTASKQGRSRPATRRTEGLGSKGCYNGLQNGVLTASITISATPSIFDRPQIVKVKLGKE